MSSHTPHSAPRRSSRQSTPTSPPPSKRGAQLPVSASTPSLSSLAPPSSATRRSSRSTSPAGSQRPALPSHAKNDQMSTYKAKLHKVKTQTLVLGDGGSVTIARVKCPVPKGIPGHLINRLDTKAISASSLFRAAFPYATEQEELSEMTWISKGSQGRYGDTRIAGAEDEADGGRKLSGTWIPIDKAGLLATEYGILRFAKDLIEYAIPSSTPSTATAASNDADVIILESDNEASPAKSKSPPPSVPRSKRARVTSPSVTSTPTALRQTRSRSPLIVQASEDQPMGIMQALSASADTDELITTTTTTTEVTVLEVEVDVPAGNPEEDRIEKEIRESKALVEALKQEKAEAALEAAEALEDEIAAAEGGEDSKASTSSSSSKKRSHVDDEDEEDDEPLPTTGTLADVPTEKKGFFGFGGKKRGKAPKTASREIKGIGSQVALLEKKEEVQGRRWVAGFGLALAVGAVSAVPYFFG